MEKSGDRSGNTIVDELVLGRVLFLCGGGCGVGRRYIGKVSDICWEVSGILGK